MVRFTFEYLLKFQVLETHRTTQDVPTTYTCLIGVTRSAKHLSNRNVGGGGGGGGGGSRIVVQSSHLYQMKALDE